MFQNVVTNAFEGAATTNAGVELLESFSSLARRDSILRCVEKKSAEVTPYPYPYPTLDYPNLNLALTLALTTTLPLPLPLPLTLPLTTITTPNQVHDKYIQEMGLVKNTFEP